MDVVRICGPFGGGSSGPGPGYGSGGGSGSSGTDGGVSGLSGCGGGCGVGGGGGGPGSISRSGGGASRIAPSGTRPGRVAKRGRSAPAAGIPSGVAKTNGGAGSEPERSARSAGLRYVSDDGPGIMRRRRGRGFQYVRPDGSTITDRDERSRIESLAIPPAWTDVWICPVRTGHIQATGRDARGRKQYRYHPRWREVRDETKYYRLAAFARALPRIRRRVDRDMRRHALSRERVVATVVRLLDVTTIRVGNDEYARENRSYGLTTLRERHVDVNGGRVAFRFRGKGGRVHDVDVDDPRVARVIRRCEELPGQHLFQYVDADGRPAEVTSDDVNEYIREAAGHDFTAKDFRTWTGTVLAAWTLDDLGAARGQAKRQLVSAIESVAQELGNTPAVCRACYVHPDVIDAHLDGTLKAGLKRQAARTLSRSRHRLSPHEAAVLAFLERRLAKSR
jgi:DNA topoisomerase I